MSGHVSFCCDNARQLIMREYDRRTEYAFNTLVQQFEPDAGETRIDRISDLSRAPDNNWNALFSDDTTAIAIDSNEQFPRRPRTAPNLVPSDEDGDPERPENGQRPGTLHAQRSIMALVDHRRGAVLHAAHTEKGERQRPSTT